MVVNKDLRAKAYKIIALTMEEAKSLPNFLGKIVPMQLKINGYYACKDELGIRYYELKNS